MTDTKSNWEKIKANLKTEEELLAEGWSLHTTCSHILGAGPMAWQLGRDNPDLEYEIASGDSEWETKIMFRSKE